MTLTFSHLSADSFKAHLKAGRKRPRVREAVSCWQCRTRKTRCDRESPCGQCKHRGIALDCAYSTPKDQSAAPRSRSRVTKKTTTTTPTAGQTPQQHFLEVQTHTPPESCSSRGETPELASASLPTPVSIPASRVQRSEQPNASASPTPGGTAFRGSAFKTRMVGLSHWMAPCNEMIVLKAMLDHSTEFHTSRKAFAELKAQLRAQNTIPPPPLSADCAALRSLLPERRECDAWLAKYLQSYGRIYGILDEPAFMRDYEMIYDGTVNHPVHISKILLAVAIAMQSSEPDRLEGRRLARAVEDCIHTSKFQKPCVGVVQVLLLLLVLKTISASDTDKIYDLWALQGLTTQVVSSMGLQRDPALFVEVTPYYAELRKRLWACFVRLNLEYCVRSGTQFSLRLDQSDCPLPTMETSLRALDDEPDGTLDVMREEQEATDVAFAIAATKLVKIIGPLHQALYSPNPPSSVELQRDLRTGFGKLLSELPSALKPGAKPSDPIEEMQRCLISIPMTSFLSISSLGATLGTPADASQKSQLMDIWDNAASVLSQFQNLCERNREISIMACQFLWTDAARSALTSCWILGRLRQLDNNRIICYPQQTGGMFREVLTRSLTFLSGLWQARYHLGVVAAKLNLLLAVSLNVTAKMYTDELDPASFRQKLFADASAAAEALIAAMKYDLQQHQQPAFPTTLVSVHDTSSLSPTNGICAAWSPSNTDLLGVTEPLSSVSTPLMGHDFLAIDFPSDTAFPSLYHDFGFPVIGNGMFQGGGPLPTFDEQTMVSMW